MNPLHKLHEQGEAEFVAYGETQMVATFGEPQAEYAAVHKGCALLDLAQRGILEVRGADRIDFLNRFLTNQLKLADGKSALPAGHGVYAFLLNNKGRIVADMNVLERGDCTLLETDARNVANLQQALGKYVFSEKVEFTSRLDASHELSLHGPGALEVARRVLGDFGELGLLRSAGATFDGADVTVWRDDPCGVTGYYVICAADRAAKLWMTLVSAFEPEVAGKRAVRPAGWAVYNTARIEAGRPLYGIDFDDSVLPAETSQLDRAVSFTKGCYLGQEIVARMHARQQVARKIVGIRMVEDALPMAGAPIVDDKQNPIGGITSSTVSPILSRASIALGMVKSASSAAGAQLLIAAEGAFRRGVVVELPFIKRGEF